MPAQPVTFSASADPAAVTPPSSGLRDLTRRRPDLLGFYTLQLVSAVLLYAVLILLPMRLAELGVTDPRYVAPHAAGLSAAMTAVGLGYAPLRRRLGDHNLVRLAFATWVLTLAGLSLTQQRALLALAVVIFGIGMGLAVPALTVLIAEAAPAPLRGRATSLAASATFLGQAAAPLLLGPVTSVTSITTGFAVTSAMAAISMVLVPTARRRVRLPTLSHPRAPAQETCTEDNPEPRRRNHQRERGHHQPGANPSVPLGPSGSKYRTATPCGTPR